MKGIRWTTAGESHGPALLAILEGLPAGMALDLEHVDRELARRQGGYGRGGRMRIESDRVELLSGVRAGLTLGSPLAVRILNKDSVIESLPVPGNPRPGHADLAGCQKYSHRDPRAVLERASARETAARVALGGLARQLLEGFGVEIFAHVVSLGEVQVGEGTWERAGDARRAVRDASELYCLDGGCEERMKAAVDRARQERDSLGGVFEVRVLGLPPGLGGYANATERLTSRLGAALFSIPAMKGVEFGLGFESARLPGSRVHDPIVPAQKPGPWGRFARSSNHAGGLEGGMTNGEALLMRVAMKPIPSLKQGMPSVDFRSGEAVQATYQRSDVTSVPAASVVGEALVALELTAAFLEKFAGDSIGHVASAFESYCTRLQEL